MDNSKRVFKKILVIGDKHQEIIDKYDDKTVPEYICARYKDADKDWNTTLSNLEKIMNSDACKAEPNVMRAVKEQYDDIKSMTALDFYYERTEGLKYDADGNAVSDKNPLARYQYPKCYQESLRKYGEDGEGVVSDPFILKDGTKSYVALKKDIDWDKMNNGTAHMYERVWELVIDKSEPKNKEEELILVRMNMPYVAQFKTKERFAKYYSAFWCYGVATSDEYVEYSDLTSDSIDWANNFYDRFIVPLSDDTMLSLYEAKHINWEKNAI